MTTTAIREWHERPTPFPTEFLWTKTLVERTTVLKKQEGVYVSESAAFGHYRSSTTPAYFIFVMTEHGDMRIDVSKKVFDLLREGDPLIVSYRRGYWSGALKGKIAR